MEDRKSNYKYENIITRKFTKKSRKQPKDPLTNEERKYLTDKYRSDFATDYTRFAIKMGCLSDDERANLSSCRSVTANGLLNDDLINDSFLLFCVCLDKFDKERYKGRITESNEKVWGGKKTLDYFFMAQGRKMIIYHFRDTLKPVHKKGNDSYLSGDIELDGDDFADTSECDQETQLLIAMASEEGVNKVAKIIGIKESISFISYIFKKKFNLFSDSELQYEYGKDRTIWFSKKLKKLLKR